MTMIVSTYLTFPLFTASVISFLRSGSLAFFLDSSAWAIARSTWSIASLNLFRFLGLVVGTFFIVTTFFSALIPAVVIFAVTHPFRPTIPCVLFKLFVRPVETNGDFEVILFAADSIVERAKSRSSSDNPFT